MLNSFSDIKKISKAYNVKQNKDCLKFNWKCNKKKYLVIITSDNKHSHVSISHKNPNTKPEMVAIQMLVDICFDGSSPVNLYTKGGGIRPNVFHIFEKKIENPLKFTLRNKNYEQK